MSGKKLPKLPNPPMTGWPPGMLQDDSKPLTEWLANRPNARQEVRHVAELAVKDVEIAALKAAVVSQLSPNKWSK